FRVQDSGSGFRVQDSGSGFRVQDSGSGFRVCNRVSGTQSGIGYVSGIARTPNGWGLQETQRRVAADTQCITRVHTLIP
ncbi:hypothetical protein T484DRAFT_1631631, partial [Baffinella frigidus]